MSYLFALLQNPIKQYLRLYFLQSLSHLFDSLNRKKNADVCQLKKRIILLV